MEKVVIAKRTIHHNLGGSIVVIPQGTPGKLIGQREPTRLNPNCLHVEWDLKGEPPIRFSDSFSHEVITLT